MAILYLKNCAVYLSFSVAFLGVSEKKKTVKYMKHLI